MLNNKTVLITGSTSGIGLGMAQRFAELNANIILNGFGNSAEIELIVSQLQSVTAGKVIYSPANMLNVGEIEQMVSMANDSFGRVDILINNAGIQYVSPIDEFPLQKWDDIIAINLSSAFHTIRLCLPNMRQQGWGRIINIASVHGLVASANKSAYITAKHGLVGLTKTVALETAELNITANAICPGFVLTPLVEQQIKDKAKRTGDVESATKQLLAEKQPSKTFVQIEQVAQYAAFLCSDAAEQITGSALPMDGGWAAQ